MHDVRCGRQASQSRVGMTLMELLVVIGVLTMLVGLLVPSISAVASHGRSMRCQSNLRQMAAASQSYAAVWDAWPAAIRFEQKHGQFRRVAWDWVTTFSGQLISAGPLWGYSTNPGDVQQCPEFDGHSTFDGDPQTGYNYNTSYLGGEAPFPSLGWAHLRRGVSPSGCRRACSCAMFGDGGWKSGANKFMRAPLNPEGHALSVTYGGGQAFRHRHETNIAHVDGHVGSVGRAHRGQLQTSSLLSQFMAFPRNGFLSDDDASYDPR